MGAERRECSQRLFPVSLLAIARSMRMLMAAWRQNSRDQRRLAAMSDRELQDIGVCRGEVADRIGCSFWREMNGRLS
jgi:uncharacterized protein YjiS (DUF1127 family)